jgi:alkanesulfonate monooxygenase SsuD/methylene tetrahydromethanopterin reductase-like flavin-dependent oxidoreductase (luciferase family)
MKIGLFDHVEDGNRPLAQLFDERLQFAQAAEEAGIYCLQVAEHHATPLSLIPSPSIYLSALARATKRVRVGPLVYLLPLYTPLRMIEEICMLDHLSHGRLEVGVGRGVSPHELRAHKVEFNDSREIFTDAFKCISAGLTSDNLTYRGKHFTYENVPIALRPLQQPNPPFWYASSNPAGATWAGENGLHFVTLGPVKVAKAAIDAYRTALAKRGAVAQPRPEFPGGGAVGVQRMIVVADSDAEARHFGKPALDLHVGKLTWLRDKLGNTAGLNLPFGADYDAWVANGTAIAGTPDKVRAEIERQTKELGVNYLLSYLFFGNMALKDAMRSLGLFQTEVMPHLAKL